jgi:hypothetical protein
MRTLLGFAALGAFVAWCFARGRRRPPIARRAAGGDGGRPRMPAPSGRHTHAGDPTVRH